MKEIKDLKIKIVTGYRKDQEFTIDADEAHKAYFLFLNPEKRGVFNNGLAILGSDIRSILPDYQATMGWMPTAVLDGYDWQEIKNTRVDRQLKELMMQAKIVAQNNPEKIAMPLSEIIALLPESPLRIYTKGPTSIGELLPKEIKENEQAS